MPIRSSKLPRSRLEPQLAEFPGVVMLEGQLPQYRGRWGGGGRRLIVEVGCADGATLVNVARRHPERLFFGIDWKCKDILDAAACVVQQELTNVRLARWRAQDLGVFVAPGEAEEIWVFHPEPCEREEERPNRLVSAEFLQTAVEALDAGGRFVLKTDHRGYFDWVQAQIEAMPRQQFGVEICSVNFWNDPPALEATATALWSGQISRYEMRFHQKRKPIHFLQLRKR